VILTRVNQKLREIRPFSIDYWIVCIFARCYLPANYRNCCSKLHTLIARKWNIQYNDITIAVIIGNSNLKVYGLRKRQQTL